MKRKNWICISLSLIMILAASLACEAPGTSSDTGEYLGATETMRVLASVVAGTLEPAAEEESSEAEETEDGAESESSEPDTTPTSSATPTLDVPMVRVSVDTNCRFGPGNLYEYQGALLVGESARVTGKLADESFWYIENPDAPPPYCWIWAAYAQVEGDTSEVPILTPPPPPLDFDLSIDIALDCFGNWGIFFKIENIGSEAIESWQVTATVSDLGETATETVDVFLESQGCAFLGPPPAALAPDASGYVSAFVFSVNPTGHNVQATVRMCTEDGLGGKCVEKNVSGVVPSP